MKNKYIDHKRVDLKLMNINDLKVIHDIDFELIGGVKDFSGESWRNMLESFLVNFFNKHDIEERMNFEPLKFSYIDENKPYVKFEYKRNGKDEWLHVTGPTNWY